MDAHNSADHLTDLELAAYIDRGMSAADYSRAESHLADCAECRRHLVETKTLIDRRERPRKLGKVAATVVAAAVVAFLIVNPKISERQTDADARMRTGSSTDVIVAYAPIGEVSQSRVRFAWTSAGRNSVYRLTLNSAGGDSVWSASTTDTSVVLPSSVPVSVGQQYFWLVDALTADGRTLSTGLKEFSVAR